MSRAGARGGRGTREDLLRRGRARTGDRSAGSGIASNFPTASICAMRRHDLRGSGTGGRGAAGAQGSAEAAPGRSRGAECLWLHARGPQPRARPRARSSSSARMPRHRATPRFSTAWVGCCTGRGTASRRCLTCSAAYADDRGGDIGAHLRRGAVAVGRHNEADQVWAEAGAVDADNRVLNATRQRLHAAQ